MNFNRLKSLRYINPVTIIKIPFRKTRGELKKYYLHYKPISLDTEKFLSLNNINSIEEFDNELSPFFFNPHNKLNIVEYIKKNYFESFEQTIKDSELICKHQINFLGTDNIQLKELNWHLDFKNGYQWDSSDYFISNNKIMKYYYNGISADIKVPWELNRFQHLITLGKGYWFTQNEKYSKEFVSQINSWINKNPIELGINWACAMEVAIRAINWIWGYYFFYQSENFNDKNKFKFLKTLFLHGEHIYNNLELEIKSNHYISNIVGLLFLGVFFKNSSEGQKWINNSIIWLEEEMNRQIKSEGVDYEKSINYHRLVTELFLSAAILAEKNNIKLSKRYLQRLEKMIEFIRVYLYPDGSAPQIGDNDDGKLHILADYYSNKTDHSYLITIGSLFFKRNDTTGKEKIQRECCWLLSGNINANLENKISYESKSFPKSGFYFMKNEKMQTIIDCVNPNPKLPQGHRHNSALNFELFAYNKKFIVDPGSFIYTENKDLRNLFRSTSYHNVVEVDGKEQNQFDENIIFYMGTDAKVKVNNWLSNKHYDFINAEHYGYNRLTNPITHRRRIYFDKRDNYLITKDSLIGKGLHNFDLYFHFYPLDIRFDENDKTTIKTNENGPNLIISPLEQKDLKSKIQIGFYSPNYGYKTRAPILKYSKKTKAPVEFINLIYPYQNKNIESQFDEIKINAKEIIKKEIWNDNLF